MQLIIESPGLHLQDSLLSLIQTRFAQLEKMFGRITRGVVLLKKETHEHTDQYQIEADILVPGKVLHARDLNNNFEASLYKVVDKLNRQLYRYKTEKEEIW